VAAAARNTPAEAPVASQMRALHAESDAVVAVVGVAPIHAQKKKPGACVEGALALPWAHEVVSTGTGLLDPDSSHNYRRLLWVLRRCFVAEGLLCVCAVPPVGCRPKRNNYLGLKAAAAHATGERIVVVLP
jgi:hypothetical protein